MAPDSAKPARTTSEGSTPPAGDAAGPGRRAGRRQRLAVRRDARPQRAPYVQRRIATYDILSEEGLSLIEQNADAILRDVGMEVRNDPEALRYYREAGADVQGSRVRFEPGFCRQIITESAPREFIQHARNPDNKRGHRGAQHRSGAVMGPPVRA